MATFSVKSSGCNVVLFLSIRQMAQREILLTSETERVIHDVGLRFVDVLGAGGDRYLHLGSSKSRGSGNEDSG